MPRIERAAIQAELDRYITGNFLSDAPTAALAADTPLLEWGVLNSLNLLRLITHIKETFGVTVPPAHVTGSHFKNLSTITDLVYELSPQPA